MNDNITCLVCPTLYLVSLLYYILAVVRSDGTELCISFAVFAGLSMYVIGSKFDNSRVYGIRTVTLRRGGTVKKAKKKHTFILLGASCAELSESRSISCVVAVHCNGQRTAGADKPFFRVQVPGFNYSYGIQRLDYRPAARSIYRRGQATDYRPASSYPSMAEMPPSSALQRLRAMLDIPLYVWCALFASLGGFVFG